jgi:acetyl esterase/lipase
MNKYFLFFITILLTSVLYSQCDTLRYKYPVFENLQVHTDVKYGEGQVWYFPYSNTDLHMDIYEPIDDSLTNRPLMVWVHSGGFLAGSKEAEDMVALCDSFAKRGYMTASINYRLGFNPTSPSSAERAVYRGLQDARAAIRFLKENHIDYGIDTNYTFIGGSSAGGFSALHTAYLEQNEAPSSIQGGLTYPDLGCLDCSGNNYQHSMGLSGITNLWGAIGDSNWISPYETVPALLIHGTNDGIVPYGVGHPFGVFTTPITHGSRSISNQLNALNIPHETKIFIGEGHEPHGTSNGDFDGEPTPYWDTIFDAVEQHYFSVINPGNSLINVPNEVCLYDTIAISATNGEYFCWSGTNFEIIEQIDSTIKIVFTEPGIQTLNVQNYSSILAAGNGDSKSVLVHELPNSSYEYTLNPPSVNFSANTLGYTNYIWDFDDGTIINGISPTHTYTSAAIYYPTLFVTDANGCKSQTSQMIDFSTLQVNNVELEKSLIVYPNPTQDKLHLKSANSFNKISVLNTLGQLIRTYQGANKTNQAIDVSELPSGIYTLKVILTDGSKMRAKFSKL